ncbi:hypothetical protein [Marivita cryptomonadis]|uniref:hypothetical protein n=1 Tax=Marivita cryptomonadis TaxID=505252 RepID=UPI00391C5ADB
MADAENAVRRGAAAIKFSCLVLWSDAMPVARFGCLAYGVPSDTINWPVRRALNSQLAHSGSRKGLDGRDYPCARLHSGAGGFVAGVRRGFDWFVTEIRVRRCPMTFQKAVAFNGNTECEQPDHAVILVAVPFPVAGIRQGVLCCLSFYVYVQFKAALGARCEASGFDAAWLKRFETPAHALQTFNPLKRSPTNTHFATSWAALEQRIFCPCFGVRGLISGVCEYRRPWV